MRVNPNRLQYPDMVTQSRYNEIFEEIDTKMDMCICYARNSVWFLSAFEYNVYRRVNFSNICFGHDLKSYLTEKFGYSFLSIVKFVKQFSLQSCIFDADNVRFVDIGILLYSSDRNGYEN